MDGVQGIARGTSLVAGYAEQLLKDIPISNLYVRMLDQERPDRWMTHGLVFERIDGLRLHNLEVDWASGVKPEGGQSIVLRDVQRLTEGDSRSL